LRIACELDPRSVAPLRELARVHALLGRWDLVDRALEGERSGMDAVSLAITTMRFALWNKQMGTFLSVRESLTSLRDPLRTSAPRFSDFLDALMLATPDADGVVTLLHSIELTGSSPRRALFFLQLAAEAQSVLGHIEVTLGLLDRANVLGLTDLAWLDCCPALANLRGDPRFGSRRELVHERVAEVLRLHAGSRSERAS
jgi:serine/threonine-protein kinase